MNIGTPEKKRKTNEDEALPSLTTTVITPSPKKKSLTRSANNSGLIHDLEMDSSESSSPSKGKTQLNLHSSTIRIQENTKKVYTLIQKRTGNIGGNGHGGAIYGELTMGSMQKLIDHMKLHTGFDQHSRFIDVGSGLGKPSLHVAQDPGVAFSYGIEMECVRWTLGLANLNLVLDEEHSQRRRQVEYGNKIPNTTTDIGYKCILECGDIRSAKTFDPFTHVYMFDIGFPPTLFKELALMFNKSKSSYLICFHSPKTMIDNYGFDVELMVQVSTTMHGSSEGHMAYIYRRKGKPITTSVNAKKIICDPRFFDALELVNKSSDAIRDVMEQKLRAALTTTRPKRTRRGATFV